MTEYRAVTITDDQQTFLKDSNINFSTFVQHAIDRARCIHNVEIRPDQQKWLELSNVNLSFLVKHTIDEAMNNGQ